MPKRSRRTKEKVIEMAKSLVAKAECGEIQSFCYVAERADENYESGSTALENEFAVAGYLMSMGMRLMGFRDER
jgi:hypothetical protein